MKKLKMRGVLVWMLVFVMLMQSIVYADGCKQENSDWCYEMDQGQIPYIYKKTDILKAARWPREGICFAHPMQSIILTKCQ